MFTAVRFVRRLLMAVLLSAAISVGPVAFTSPAAPAGAARFKAEELQLSPSTGPPGQSVQVSGTGFDACGTVTLTFDGGHAVPGQANPPQISGAITVPEDSSAGDHSIEATCDPDVDSGITYHGQATFTVTGGDDGDGTSTSQDPTLELTPGNGSIGDPIDVRGAGFTECDLHAVSLYVVDGPQIASRVPIEEDGSFSYTEVIPVGTDPDTYTFRAECPGQPSIHADAELVVETAADPVLTLAEEEGESGATVDAEGTGFACSNVDLLLDGAEPVLTTAAVTEQSTFATEIPIPSDATEGAHTVRAVCQDDPDLYAEASYTITAGPTDPNTTDPNTTDPNTTDPNTTDPNTTDPNTTDPNTTDPNTTDPNTTDPNTTDPNPTDPSDNGQSSGTTTPVGLVVGSTTGVALALAAAAVVFFTRLHRGPRWVRKHVRATLRPATGDTGLTEQRAPGEPPTHTTRLEPHADPGRQTLDEEEP
ncbi:hypothetical protein ACIGEZ_21945 [Streptomyces sp. NPDC085481]|uniref:hypothetical protein n=1 Tax=Streptomyces sp. NPDC085481 TaxID=3365727 RepID=UPI0037CCD3E2